MPPNPFSAVACEDCGQVVTKNKLEEHSCNEEQLVRHKAQKLEESIKVEQGKWADEIRKRLDRDLEDYLGSRRGEFLMWLVREKRI